jgi:hypothetical protein
VTIAYTESSPGRFMRGTGAAFYAPAMLDADEFEADKKRTHIVSGPIDPVLRDVLESFQVVLVHQLAGMVARVSLLSRQQRNTSPSTFGPLAAWSSQEAERHWLPGSWSGIIGDAIIAGTGATTTDGVTVNVHGWCSEAVNFVVNGTITVSQIVNASATSLSVFNAASAVSWLDFSPIITTNFDPRIGQETFRQSTAPLTVRAVEDIADWFGVPVADVFKATGIAKRTYQEWKRLGTRRPRSSSEGRLWELHQVAADLVETIGLFGIRHWISEDPARRKLLRSGDIDKLAAQAYSSLATTDRRPAWVGAGSPEIHVAPRRNVTLSQMDTSDVVEPEL